LSSKPFTVLMVCTGNMFRSPAAQYLMNAALGPDSGLEIISAGMTPNRGGAVAPRMADLLAGEGIDVSDFESRPVSEADVRDAGLVLGMTREHRSHSVTLWPAAVRKTYTLKEFARLIDRVSPEELDRAAASTPADRLAALTTLAGHKRMPATPEEDDIPDPDTGPSGTTRQAFTEVKEAVERIAARLLAP